MRTKQELLHKFRLREFNKTFWDQQESYSNILEVGCGDGYQSVMLSLRSNNLTCFDYTLSLILEKIKRVKYVKGDVENIKEYFNEKFGLVYSSNLLEHLEDPKKFLIQTKELLNEGGRMIHIVPSPFGKLLLLLGHYPSLALIFFRPKFKGHYNNIRKKKHSLFRRIVYPVPHGVSNTNMEEFKAFHKNRWIGLFKECGFEVIEVRKGPVCSGHFFGLEWFNRILESMGFCSEWIYYLRKE